MFKNILRILILVFLGVAAYCFYEKGKYEDQLIAANPKSPTSAYDEKISLHQGFIPVTHDQYMQHLFLELGAYGAVLMCGIIVVSGKAK